MEILCVSERTLRTKRHELKISEKYTEIEDNRLDDCIQDILEENPNMGEKMLLGALKSRGIRVKRRRLRSSIEKGRFKSAATFENLKKKTVSSRRTFSR